MFRCPPASASSLERILARAREDGLTYEAVGASRLQDLPHGFRHDRYEVDLEGSVAFERAKEGLSHWQAHVGAGVAVFPGTPVVDDDTILVLLARGPFQAIAPCRIVYVIDEQDRFGLAYGTLPGHPESGEESFIIDRTHRGSVVFKVTAFSRPAHLLSRSAAPVTRFVQRRVTHRYLRGLARFVTDADGPPDGGNG